MFESHPSSSSSGNIELKHNLGSVVANLDQYFYSSDVERSAEPAPYLTDVTKDAFTLW